MFTVHCTFCKLNARGLFLVVVMYIHSYSKCKFAEEADCENKMRFFIFLNDNLANFYIICTEKRSLRTN